MLDQPRIVETTTQTAAIIRLTIPHSDIRQVMGPAIGELMATLSTQGIAPAGPLFSRHLKIDPSIFDFELGVPILSPVTPAGRVQPGQLPGARVIRTVYRGPYEELGAAWGEFCAWIAANGHATTGEVWESYLSGPESDPDPANWQTELNRPRA